MSVYEEYQHRLGIWTDIHGHLEFMHDTVLSYEAPVVIELGIQAGNSTSALLAAVIERDGFLYSCDIQSREQLAAETSGGLRRVPEDWWELPAFWKVFHGSDTSVEVLGQMPAQCDVLFVDTDHSTEHTIAVMEAYMPRVREGGVALFHDTQWVPGDADLGVPQGPVAVGLNSYCTAHGLLWGNRPEWWGMGVIRP